MKFMAKALLSIRRMDMTNYERIKAMSVEEMAKNHSYLFYEACTAKSPQKCEKTGFVNGLSPCSQCVLKWLNSEVEE